VIILEILPVLVTAFNIPFTDSFELLKLCLENMLGTCPNKRVSRSLARSRATSLISDFKQKFFDIFK
jgi:hypothetical protein